MDKETRVHIDVARTEKREQLTGEKEPKENAGIEKGKVEDKFSKMSNEIAKLCQKLTDKKDSSRNNDYERQILYDIACYIKNYDRILYSEISNTIFGLYDRNIPSEVTEEKIGNMQTNISKVVEYAYCDEYSKIIEKKNPKQREFYIKAKAISLKIQDHINLAQQQCNSLKQTDEEYKEKFERNIADFKENLTKEMNEQLITLVSIFTALAFLLFGGISSLDNIFSGIDKTSILKLVMIGCIWGICLVNLIFVFLFCVSKMTRLNFASASNPDGTIFQKYPIFWWTNYIIISIFLISAFFYFLVEIRYMEWLLKKMHKEAGIVFLLGGCVLLALIVKMKSILVEKCNNTLYKSGKNRD